MTTPIERPRRRLTRKARGAAYWADRLDAAPTSAARAAVAWDHVRTRITDLPDDAQEQAWQEVARARTREERLATTARNTPTRSTR